ncbi:hypothetical protein QNJ24_00105 [Macrococcus caseolyticus]|uniref:hypothetical protein n=1 Tax=Macrococcoides caseolyticum TaxID=69966 RepID=UPI0024BC1E7F|nr:hypothetical protein [Macrococcus caseolyticus]MDJ1154483.1 hypothetical protein [Macrococcus caseolyticus]
MKYIEGSSLKNTWDLNTDIRKVSYSLFRKRMKDGMDVYEALTSEGNRHKPRTEMGKFWEANKHRAKVTYNGYRHRLSKGMTFEEAISKENNWDTEYKKWSTIARSNGINYRVFYARVRNYGWSFEKAANTPTKTKKKNGQKTPYADGDGRIIKESDREVKEMVIALINANLPVPKKYIKRFPELFKGGA